MEVLDLFSAAAGGWSLGMHRAGFTTIAACEVEAWRRALYSQNNPDVEMYDDVRTLTAERLLADLGRLPTLIVGSPPCQDISSANTKGKGVEGERSGLYFEAIRIIGEVRPRWFALENSANLRTRGADAVLTALEAIGYACWPCVVRAGDIDANHERPRAWLIGCDLEQIGNANGESRAAGLCAASREGEGNLDRGCVRQDAEHGGGHPLYAADPARLGCGARAGTHESADAGFDGRFAGDDDGNGDAADTNGDAVRFAVVSGGPEPEAPIAGNADPDLGPIVPGHVCKHGIRWPHACGPCDHAAWDARNATDTDQARQAHGCVESGVRQAEIADDGCGAGRCDDGSRAGQVGLRAPDRSDAVGGGPRWSLADLADHLRVDDGLSARLAGTRVDLGDGKRQSAASLIVEAYGDAVVPQIPEAIGRAFMRVEAAMAAVAA